MPTRAGSCLSGQVQYRLTGEPIVARICGCRERRKASAKGAVNAILPTGAILVSASPTE